MPFPYWNSRPRKNVMKIGMGILSILIFLGVIVDTKSHETSRVHNAAEATSNMIIPMNIKTKLRTGDLVFRNGKGFISDFLRKTSQRDRKYSHVGVLVWEDRTPMVYHMIDEVGSAIGKSDLKKEPLEDFCSNQKNHGFAVYRLSTWDAAFDDSLRADLRMLAARNVRFDDQFNMDTDQKIYCTELIYKLLYLPNDINFKPSISPNGPYIGLDDLYLCKETELITSSHF
jgi:hypothetical protein